MATTKKAATKKAATKKAAPKAAVKKEAPKAATAKKAAPKKAAAKKVAPEKAAKKSSERTNKLGVKNSLVNNINAKKEKGTSKPKSKSSVSKENYKDMENNWDKKISTAPGLVRHFITFLLSFISNKRFDYWLAICLTNINSKL